MVHLSFSKELEECRNKKCWESVLARIAMHYEFNFFIYGTIIQVHGSDDITMLFTNYPDAWWNRYIDKNYMNIDRVASAIPHTSLPFNWDAPTDLSSEEARILREAASFGIVNGLTCPIHSYTNSAALSFATSQLDYNNFDKHKAELMYIAHSLHSAVINTFKTTSVKLSRQQDTTLQHLSLKLTAREISEKMGITERTAKHHISELYKKLNASTRTEALSRARIMGLLPVLDI